RRLTGQRRGGGWVPDRASPARDDVREGEFGIRPSLFVVIPDARSAIRDPPAAPRTIRWRTAMPRTEGRYGLVYTTGHEASAARFDDLVSCYLGFGRDIGARLKALLA